MTAKKSAPAARTSPKTSAAKAAGTRSPRGRTASKPASAVARPGDDADNDIDLSELESGDLSDEDQRRFTALNQERSRLKARVAGAAATGTA